MPPRRSRASEESDLAVDGLARGGVVLSDAGLAVVGRMMERAFGGDALVDLEGAARDDGGANARICLAVEGIIGRLRELA